MTIEEQITIFEHNAEHERKEGDLNNCLHFRQLAEWLKDYKRLLEQEPCEDCVSREYVIKLLENTKRTRKEITNRIYEVPSVTPQPNKWIPCSERLPEKRGCYIVTEKVFSLDDREHKGRYNTMVEQVEYYDGKWKRASFFEVVAWMPLPEPYKEESEDNG